MSKVAFVIGNGTSRCMFDLNLLKGHGTTYGCNILYRESDNWQFPDWTVAIDDHPKEMIAEDNYPLDRCIYPPEEDCFEYAGYYQEMGQWGVKKGARSNAGMNAIIEAIKAKHDVIYLLGLDFMINGEQSVSNMFADTYKKENKCTYTDSKRRVRYFDWLCSKNAAIQFRMLFPREPKQYYHKLESMNVTGMFYDQLEDTIATLNAK